MTSSDALHAERLVRSVLPAYGLAADAPLTLIKQRENTVFRLSGPDGDLAVRLHRHGYRSVAEIEAEVALVRVLAAADVPVPEFVATTDGAAIALATEPDGTDHVVDVQHWLEDAAPMSDSVEGFFARSTEDTADWERLGELAALSHDAIDAAVREGVLPARSGRAAWDLEGLAGERPVWGDPLRLARDDADRAVLASALAALRSRLAAYGEAPGTLGPIHADLTVENVMRTAHGLVLIDFDDYAEGWHLFDLATPLIFFGPHPQEPLLREALLRGYTGVRPLRQEDLDVLDAMILARALTYFGWAADRRGEPEAEHIAVNVYPHVLRLAGDFVSRPAPA